MIPKQIFFLCLGPDRPPVYAARNIAAWRALNPEWDVIVLTDATRLVTPFESFYHAEAPNFGVKSDIDRIWTLSQRGGLYVDWDVIALRPLGTLLDDCDLCVGFSYNVGPAEYPSVAEPAFLAATAGHPFLQAWLDGLPARLLQFPESRRPAWGMTGPGYCTDALNAFLDPFTAHQDAGFTQVLRHEGAKLLPYTSFYLTQQRMGDFSNSGSPRMTPAQIETLDYAHLWGAHTWEHSWFRAGEIGTGDIP